MPLQPGQLLNNRYQIIALLGQGGMGAVYRANDTAINRQVAIKEQIPDPAATPTALAHARAQFHREATVLANLDHPNLPHVTDFFSAGGNEYLTMDYVEGPSLETLAQQKGALPEATVMQWANQLLDALTYIHARGIIHRDIKPHNIVLTASGRVVLVDFGLVKLFDLNNPHTATMIRGIGTMGYAPLEQYASSMGHTDARTDIYALGATLYRLLTGCAPCDVQQRVLNPTALAAPRSLNPNISPQVEWMILKAMEIHPQNRFPSAEQMKLAVTMPIFAQTPSSAAPAQSYSASLASAQTSRFGTSQRVLLAIIGILATCIIITLVAVIAALILPRIAPSPTRTPIVAPIATGTPTITLVPTTTHTPTMIPTLTPSLTPTPTSTPTITPSPTITPIPSATPRPAGNCADPGAQITNLQDNLRLDRYQRVYGTAYAKDFAFYDVAARAASRLSENRPDLNAGVRLYRSGVPVVNGPLMAWDTTTVPTGFYDFVLVVFLNDGSNLAPCLFTVYVGH